MKKKKKKEEEEERSSNWMFCSGNKTCVRAGPSLCSFWLKGPEVSQILRPL